jgi:uncharacterized protein YbaR (Trm112 family)/ubiquinone/menaquinone biosynthesis C-methylase UbiE
MRLRHLQYLCCPDCRADFKLEVKEQQQTEIVSGKLICHHCNKVYEIKDGIPRILAENIEREKIKSAESFSYEWKNFRKLTDKYKEQFLDWIKPVPADFFKDKVVLDAGCGKGRHVYWSAKFEAKDVIGVDLGSTVEVAYQNTREFENVSIIQADIYHLPLKPVFDYIYSIGVLHHLPTPSQGFDCLVKLLKPGGRISAWVYGREGNGWIIYGLNPIRKFITSKLPLPITKAIAFCLALILQPLVKLIYKPVNEVNFLKPLRQSLFYNEYLYYISKFSFKENYSIIFDHLLAPTAFYISRDEFAGWFKKNGLQQVQISWHNKNSWRGTGVK